MTESSKLIEARAKEAIGHLIEDDQAAVSAWLADQVEREVGRRRWRSSAKDWVGLATAAVVVVVVGDIMARAIVDKQRFLDAQAEVVACEARLDEVQTQCIDKVIGGAE